MLAGCATARIDWSGRIGHYNVDQAIVELGPPDKQAKLGDGTVVAEWLVRRGYSHGFVTHGYGYPAWHGGVLYPDFVESTTPDDYLRLVFGPDGQLKQWKQFTK